MPFVVGAITRAERPESKNRRAVMVKRFKGLAGVVALVMLASFVAGCKTTTSPGRQIDDASIKTAVKAKLAADVKLSTLTNIEVNSTNGVVTLAGQVDNPDQKLLAAEVARTVDGVVKVNNELQVKNR
jgi:osmotically-inducible protein OsmY